MTTAGLMGGKRCDALTTMLLRAAALGCSHYDRFEKRKLFFFSLTTMSFKVNAISVVSSTSSFDKTLVQMRIQQSHDHRCGY